MKKGRRPVQYRQLPFFFTLSLNPGRLHETPAVQLSLENPSGSIERSAANNQLQLQTSYGLQFL
jgi:hypothetical protein